jgi:hypothetical protein
MLDDEIIQFPKQDDNDQSVNYEVRVRDIFLGIAADNVIRRVDESLGDDIFKNKARSLGYYGLREHLARKNDIH